MKGYCYRNSLIIGVLIVLSLIVIRTIGYNVKNTKQRNFNNPTLYHSTKSVDGEHQYSEDTQWKSHPSKCFDCETQMKETCGDACVYKATKQKVFNM